MILPDRNLGGRILSPPRAPRRDLRLKKASPALPIDDRPRARLIAHGRDGEAIPASIRRLQGAHRSVLASSRVIGMAARRLND
jgi:hypothetical protein